MVVEAEPVIVVERYTPIGLREKEGIFIFDHHSLGNAAHDRRGSLRQDALFTLLLLLCGDVALALDRVSYRKVLAVPSSITLALIAISIRRRFSSQDSRPRGSLLYRPPLHALPLDAEWIQKPTPNKAGLMILRFFGPSR
jgi:hypothetical protein